ncbi:MAG: methyltransferase domain-containing protein [Saprospiraceae bacterium]|nr:methyltransferase domain-containing protein [Saprospiraceae bacterium]
MKVIKIIILIFVFCQIYSCRYGEGNINSILNNVNDTVDTIAIDNSTPDIGRDVWQKPNTIIQMLGDISDKTIADIGAGTGYFSFRLAFKAEKVLAIEIDTTAIAQIKESILQLPEPYKEKIETRLALESDPLLKENEVDIIVIINTVAYINDLESYFKLLKKGLRPGGKLMVVDYKMKNLPINAPPKSERIYLDKVEEILEVAGFEDIATNDTTLDYQFIILSTNPKI